jgi:multidrug efflux pump subunit AcrA (membrane-fusion protein)
MKRRILYVVLGALAIGAIGLAVIWRMGLLEQPEQEVRSAVVERGRLFVVVSASGGVEPAERVNLAFEASGRVQEVFVKVGDRVEAGALLARLDTEQMSLEARQAEAALALAEAQLEQLRGRPRAEEIASAEAEIRAAEAQVNAAVANLDQLKAGASAAEIAAAEANVASVRVQQEVSQDSHDEIVHGKGADEEEKKQAAYDLYAANEALEAAQAQLDDLQAGPDRDVIRASEATVEAAMALRDALQAQLDLLLAGATEEQIADAEAQVAQARAALELAKLSLDRAALDAPLDGVVAAVNVEVNEPVSAGMPAITVLDTSAFHITVRVDEIDVVQLTEGQAAQVTLEAFPDAIIDGVVDGIAPVATFEEGVIYYDVTIGLAPSDVPVRSDLTANATIVVEEIADALTIPTWVVRVDRLTGQTYVQRAGEGGETERVDVALGVRYQGVAEILDGLSEGDVVLWVEQETLFDLGGQ